jgi:hypothetical protein
MELTRPANKALAIKGPVVLIALFFSLSGCLSSASSDANFLLGEDYLGMTDARLTAYEQELNDALVSSGRSGSGDVNVGIGFGSWGGGTGYGVHADKWLGGGGGGSTVPELKNRRDAVRAEMQRRGLLPP